MGKIIALVTRRPPLVLVVSLLLLALFGAIGGGVTSQLKGGGFDDPNAPSSRADDLLVNQFNLHDSNLTVLVRAQPGSTIDSAAVLAQGQALTASLSTEPDVAVLTSYFTSTGANHTALRSKDGRQALIVAYVSGTDAQMDSAGKRLAAKYDARTANAQVLLGGYIIANNDITGQVTKDLAVAESIAIPVTLLLLVLAFGSLIAALLPLMVGGTSILGTFFALSLLTHVTNVSIFALNLTTALGLGLGIDYALLIVSRYREELAHDVSPVEAVRITLRTAGRTVAFSAATVAVALSALLVFPLYFLRSFGYAGIAVVLISAASALILLPAVLVLLGSRINRFALPWARNRGQIAGEPSRFWARVASAVMRRPVLVAVPITALLLFLAVPFLHVKWGLPDDRVLYKQTASRTVGDALRDDFAASSADNLTVTITKLNPNADIASYAQKLSELANVSVVQAQTGTYVSGRQVGPAQTGFSTGAASRLLVTPSVDAYSTPARTLVHAVRDTPAPGVTLVGGSAAGLVDTLHSVAQALPFAGAIIVVASLVILFLFTGSVVLPIKALIMNVISLSGVMGVIVWVFQYGHLASVLHFVPEPLSITMPLLLFCVAFGLSMDYEVFLLGRIKEQHDLGHSTTEAVVVGLARTGRIVTTAAGLLAVTFLAFLSSKVSFIQLFGLGTGLAIIIDATLVRGLLVPAFMRVLGERNWWAPAPLRRLHNRIGVSEAQPAKPAQAKVAV